jgi:hypothetical protein
MQSMVIRDNTVPLYGTGYYRGAPGVIHAPAGRLEESHFNMPIGLGLI